LPVPHIPHELGTPLQEAASPIPPPPPPATLDAKVENFFSNRVEPHFGHGVPFQSDDRTSTSLSFPHFPQWNS
jgi:hypothetical protein